MSGLLAIVHRDGAPADPEGARSALETQTARGPDAQGLWVEGPVAIGHAMLATTPEDDLAAQPFVTESGLVVALDGRIDDRESLGETLGIEARGAADVALVAAAYARWGEGFAARLTGDFAVVLWDPKRREIVAARDPLAARPLYAWDDGRTLVLASEPTCVLAASGEEARPNFDAMALFLVERYVERGATLLRGVEALVPGSVLCAGVGVGGRRPIVTRRIVPPAWPSAIEPVRRGSLDDHAEALREALRLAVIARMRARGRLAVHVSGGLDSSSIAALATSIARERGEAPPLLVRCVFPGLACDESALSDAVAAHLGLPIESVEMPGNLGDFEPREDGGAPTSYGAPRAYSVRRAQACAEGPTSRAHAYENPIAMMLVRMTERAKDLGARVTLTGAGSDQLLLPTGFELSGALSRGELRAALDVAGITSSPLAKGPYVRLLREGLYRSLPTPWRSAIRRLKRGDDGLPPWLTDAARAALRRSASEPPPALSHEAFRTEAVRTLVARIAHHADYSYSLVLADRIAGARGADMRHPFFDRRVIDLVLSFPDDVRAAAPPTKALLRRAMGSSLPDAVRDRASAAEFSPLVRSALVVPHGDRLASLLREGHLVREGLVDPRGVVRVIERARGDDDAIREVMVLASLEAWLRALATAERHP